MTLAEILAGAAAFLGLTRARARAPDQPPVSAGYIAKLGGARVGDPESPGGPVSGYAEVGVSGLRTAGGRILEEYLPQLRGTDGIRVFREMSDNDATVGAIIFAIDMLMRDVEWRAEPADDSKAAKDAAEFAESLMDDMSGSWDEFISEVLQMLVYGWSVFEIVYKKRVGPDETDPARRSKHDDGKIGVRKLAVRSQDTIWQWLFDEEDGGIKGIVQMPWIGGGSYTIPIEKLLLFRTTTRKGNPEGRSVLRTAYRPWYFLKNSEEVEAIGIERELAGLPVIYVPNEILQDSKFAAIKAAYEKIVRDLKFGEQGGVVLPSNVYLQKDGSLSSVPMVKLELVNSGGRRTIDISPVKQEYKVDIARSVMADFLTLGGSKGSYALSENKSDLFTTALGAWLDSVAAVLNTYLMPRVWDLNGWPHETMPRLLPSRVANVNLDELGKYVTALAQAGAPLFPDADLERYLRDVAHLPEKSAEIQAQQDADNEMYREMQAGQMQAAQPAAPGATPDAGAPQPKRPGAAPAEPDASAKAPTKPQTGARPQPGAAP